MKKYIVLSVNDNVDYLYFTPLTVWAWRKFGWDVIIMYNGILKPLADVWLNSGIEPPNVQWIGDNHGYRSDTVTQVSRLYAACVIESPADYLLTSDIDMLPLSDYWKPNYFGITVYGHDLTGYTHFPLCYVGMPVAGWVQIMGLSSGDYNSLIKRDLDTMPQAKGEWEKRWFTDQDLITQRIQQTEFPVTHIKRGQLSNGYAIGRVDRGAWTLNHKQYIDAHLFHQMYHKGREEYFEKTLDLLYHIWPDEDFGWLVSYTHKFRALTGHK